MKGSPRRRSRSIRPIRKARPGFFATGLYRDQLEAVGPRLKFRDKLILLDTFAIPSLLATPL